MVDDGCPPNEYTYNIIIRGFLHGNDISKSLELVSVMTTNGFAADAHTTSVFVDLLIDPRVSKENKALL